jgi:hypothetical protein
VTLYGISIDSPEDSLKFTQLAGINFPLLSDRDGAVARKYVGLNYDGTALPGIIIIGADGRIVFRQIATAKDDRMTAGEVIDTVDRTLGTSGRAADAGYVAVERIQNRGDSGVGEVIENHQRRVTLFLNRGVLVPVNRYLMIGPWLALEPRQAPLDVDFAAMLRAPFFGDIAALEVIATAGWSPFEVSGWNAGIRGGLFFAVSPTVALVLDVGYSLHRVLDSDRDPAAFVTFGVTKLLRKPGGPFEP